MVMRPILNITVPQMSFILRARLTGPAAVRRIRAEHQGQGIHTLPNSALAPVSNPPFTRLSRFWLASGGFTAVENEEAHAKLVRAGYIRQSHAGIFHMLPLGQRVQEKLENLINKHMAQLGASKVSLSSISSQALWEQTDRFQSYGPELFRLADRKDIPYLLAPTHEEEITTLVSKTVKSYKDLPLRLYQIGRKYRDELRPRHGILRSREFVMKDLYTFDHSTKSALSTYEDVRSAYSRLFGELKIPYLVAEASSGDIGGDLSHEYHLPTSAGEDNVMSCDTCNYVANEELAVARLGNPGQTSTQQDDGLPVHQQHGGAHVWRGISKDRSTLVNVWYPGVIKTPSSHDPVSTSDADLNLHAIKSIVPGLDLGLGNTTSFWTTTHQSSASASGHPMQILNIIDHRLGQAFPQALLAKDSDLPLVPQHSDLDPSTIPHTCLDSLAEGGIVNVIKIRDGDGCPKCSSGSLKIQKAVELGHTFHLGTRYSTPLGAHVQVPPSFGENTDRSPEDKKLTLVPIQMGCHGIGVSRVIGAVAAYLADDKGLNWPRVIAPFEVVVVPGKGFGEDAAAVASILANQRQDPESEPVDVALDDRADSVHSLPWKMKDADLIGYPILVILGRKWGSDRLCEVQCRRLGIVNSYKSVEELPSYIRELLAQL